MDDIDIKILKSLQINARVTISDLSNEIGMSMPAISERLKKLEASGVIEQYCAILNPQLLNKQLMALMFISLENPRFSDSFAEFVKYETEIQECFYIAGDFDYSLKIITENTLSLERLLNRIKTQSGVQKTKTTVVLSVITSRPSVTPD
ncbi:Lrp/AsnC family transcriptional regulator [Dendrosporobacter sp. 1207_IL3150]|uniref:Lrp/AsnC family transcriptional regulator n=1 Tax=Dendrosporobacter sp. 1207_IL3150 TaxID=3084054 RepID=UPI002FDAB1FC